MTRPLKAFYGFRARSARSDLCHADLVGYFDVLYSEPDVRRTGSGIGCPGQTAENHESRHAAVHRLDQSQLPEWSGHLLGCFQPLPVGPADGYGSPQE